MKCIVTGSAGNIGSHLVAYLQEQGHEVFGIDDFSTGHRDNERCETRRWDITQYPFRHKAKADWFFHLAALADIVPSIERPELYHRANVSGTVRMLEWARRSGVKRFVYAASSSCYGIPAQYPTPETAPCDPQYPYALTKYLGEQYVLHYARVYGLPTVSLRLFNVYGPRFRTRGAYGAVFGVFLAQLAQRAPLTVVGDGTQRRDFTYVTDVCRAFVAAAEADCVGEVFNVGTGRPTSVNEIVQLLGAKDVVHLPKRPGEPDLTYADAKRAARILGWHATTPVANGVQALLRELPLYEQAPLWTPESIAHETKGWFECLGAKSV